MSINEASNFMEGKLQRKFLLKKAGNSAVGSCRLHQRDASRGKRFWWWNSTCRRCCILLLIVSHRDFQVEPRRDLSGHALCFHLLISTPSKREILPEKWSVRERAYFPMGSQVISLQRVQKGEVIVLNQSLNTMCSSSWIMVHILTHSSVWSLISPEHVWCIWSSFYAPSFKCNYK